MTTRAEESLIQSVTRVARPFRVEQPDFESVLGVIGNARVVLIGEATHGTHEFYRWRANLTRRLIVDHGFAGVAAEADWPDAYRVNRYVRALDTEVDARSALGGFVRFPAWMWRNTDVLEFIDWLRAHNDDVRAERRVGFYGLDLYSLHASIAAVLDYLERVDPAGGQRVRERYACFDHFGADPERYAYRTSLGLDPDCESEVLATLVDLQARRADMLARDRRAGLTAQEGDDEHYQAEQNARVVQSAEHYYRAMFSGRVSTWNLRDTHMMETLERLRVHLDRRWGAARVVVWAHNSHVGDASATQLARAGELNVGQLARERFGDEVRLIGQTTYEGTVTAAADWGAPAAMKRVRPALPGSYEDLFHRTELGSFTLASSDVERQGGLFDKQLLERAIGVVYRPDTERTSHYFHADIARQFDAVIHIDETHALEPFERKASRPTDEEPETYPTGL
jgi:erythromycin esterase-like protein